MKIHPSPLLSRPKWWFIPIRLRTFLFIIFLLLSLTLVVFNNWLWFQTSRTAVKDLSDRLQLTTTDRVADDLRRFLKTSWNLAANNADILKDTPLTNSARMEIARTMYHQINTFDETSFLLVTNARNEVYVIEQGENDQLLIGIHEPHKEPGLSFYIADGNGLPGELFSYNALYALQDRAYYQAAVHARKATWSEPFQTIGNSRWYIATTHPVFTSSGGLSGIAVSGIDIELFSNYVEEVTPKVLEAVYVVDQHGLMIASSIPGAVLSADGTERLLARENPISIIQASALALRPERSARHTLTDVDLDGRSYSVEVMPFYPADGLIWTIVALVPNSVVMGSITRAAINTGWISGFVLILVVIMGVVISNFLTSPIVRLNKLAQSMIHQREYQIINARNPVREVHDLAMNFNQMVLHIQLLISNLEETVAERTAELTSANQKLQQEIQHRERIEERMREMINTDPLTSIFNRRYLENLGAREFERARRYHTNLSIVFMDIDHFKRINDSLGHLAGDEVLRQIAEKITLQIRDTDLFARYGGEEFVVLMPDTDLEHAVHAAERLRVLIADTEFKLPDNSTRLTISLGVASIRPEDENLQAIFARSDQALYQAKKLGRNRVASNPDYLPMS